MSQYDFKAKNDEYEFAQEYELASFGSRFAAIFIDGIILMIPNFIFLSIVNSDNMLASIFVSLVYNWYFWTRSNGQTPGKSAMGIRVIKTDGSAISDTDAFLRVIGYSISGMFMLLGYIWALFDSKNQAWHDKIAGTYVIRAQPKKNKTVIV